MALIVTTCLWIPPVPYPNDPNPFNMYAWDETTQTWVLES